MTALSALLLCLQCFDTVG